MACETVTGDLLDQDVEVIVNAWNRNIIPWWLLLPQGVAGAIKRSAGYAPFIELGRKGPIPLGGAVETGAGKLPFCAIIHVAGINLFWFSSERAVRDCMRNAQCAGDRRRARLWFDRVPDHRRGRWRRVAAEGTGIHAAGSAVIELRRRDPYRPVPCFVTRIEPKMDMTLLFFLALAGLWAAIAVMHQFQNGSGMGAHYAARRGNRTKGIELYSTI